LIEHYVAARGAVEQRVSDQRDRLYRGVGGERLLATLAASFRRLQLASGRGRESLDKQGVEEAAAGGGRSVEVHLQLVADRHQRIDLGDCAALLVEWRGGISPPRSPR
jgi:hypothetical protein